MITTYVRDLALQAGVHLSKISIVEGKAVGCLDSYLIHITSNEQLVSSLVYQHDVDNLHNGRPCDRLNLRIRNALNRLKIQTEF
jgi:hypothetical protein